MLQTRMLFLMVIVHGLHAAVARSHSSDHLELRLTRHIVAIGGGEITDPTKPSAMRAYLLRLPSVHGRKPKICLLPQARTRFADYDNSIANFTNAFGAEGAEVSFVALDNRSVDPREIEQQLLNQDIIYVDGGNACIMLEIWKKWGIDKVLEKAYEKGIVLAGVGTGAICWFQQGITENPLSPIECLGILSGSCCPQYDSESDRKAFYTQAIADKSVKKPAHALNNYTALHVVSSVVSHVASDSTDKIHSGEIYRNHYLTWKSPQETEFETDSVTHDALDHRTITVAYSQDLIELKTQEI